MADKKTILYLLDSDPIPSVFDINVAYDSGYDIVVPIGGVNSSNIRTIIEDAMFSRGDKNTKFTKVLLNGSDHVVVKENLVVARESMVPPMFELSISIDPRGGYTTGSSIVAQVESDLHLVNKKNLSECKAIVFGGTGMVGQTVSVLCSKFGAETYLCSRSLDRAERITKLLNTQYDIKCRPISMTDDSSRIKICNDKDLIFTCGTAGVQMISANVIKNLPPHKIFADVNAVPPLGIEGIKYTWKGKEHNAAPNLFMYGALSIGDVKLRVEKRALQMLMNAPGDKTFSFIDFYQFAKQIIDEKKKKEHAN